MGEATPARLPHLVITGSSGRLGRRLVETARRDGWRVTRVARPGSVLPPDEGRSEVVSLDELDAVLGAESVLVHLAARNNDQPGTRAEFETDNAASTRLLLGIAARSQLRKFILASTHRAAQPNDRDHYGHSKRAAEETMNAAKGVNAVALRFPALRADDMTFAGRLNRLNILPRSLRPIRVVSALRPELSIASAVESIMHTARQTGDGEPIQELGEDKDRNAYYRFGKRTVDIAFALAVLIVFPWLLLAIWLAVKLTSPGPGLFVQDRVGRHQQVFRCYKFRTMRTGTENAASHMVSRDAATPVGRFLRRVKLDELPQVINLLRGELSLVGPRPSLPSQTELIAARAARGVFSMLPGITGWAQINDVDMSDPDRLARFDQQYFFRRSLIFDMRILLDTFLGKGRADRTMT